MSLLPPFDLSGTWALEVVVTTSSKAPLIGEVRSVSKSRMLVHVTPGAERDWSQRQEVCASWFEGGSKLAHTVLPPAWIRALPPRAYAATLTPGDGGWAYGADPGVQVIGYDAARGPLPTRGTDANVRDTDGDGRPGATVLVEVPAFSITGEVYVAQRGHSRLSGRVVSPDRIEGAVVIVELSQATLGASHEVFDFSPVTRPVPARSTFAMWRVAAGADCSEL